MYEADSVPPRHRPSVGSLTTKPWADKNLLELLE